MNIEKTFNVMYKTFVKSITKAYDVKVKDDVLLRKIFLVNLPSLMVYGLQSEIEGGGFLDEMYGEEIWDAVEELEEEYEDG